MSSTEKNDLIDPKLLSCNIHTRRVTKPACFQVTDSIMVKLFQNTAFYTFMCSLIHMFMPILKVGESEATKKCIVYLTKNLVFRYFLMLMSEQAEQFHVKVYKVTLFSHAKFHLNRSSFLRRHMYMSVNFGTILT